jgi:diamine N-acetyltransferase
MNLRRATSQDLPFILTLEARFHALGFINSDGAEAHQRQMVDPDYRYWIVEERDAAAGYVMLRSVCSPHRNIEIRRAALVEPGKGLGRQVFSAVMTKAFDELSAHRLWMDVYDDHDRALGLYRSLGFVQEGVLRECVGWEGRFRSLVIMSMLEHEYRARAQGTPAAAGAP